MAIHIFVHNVLSVDSVDYLEFVENVGNMQNWIIFHIKNQETKYFFPESHQMPECLWSSLETENIIKSCSLSV